jgi:hypothetical protein
METVPAFGQEAFRVQAATEETLGEQVVSILDGRTPAVRVRGFLSGSECATAAAAFSSSQATVARSDGVAGRVLGAYHYRMTQSDYAETVRAGQTDVDEVLAVSGDPLGRILQAVERAVAPFGHEVRAARWDEVEAARMRISSWEGHGTYALEPHEDVGQLRDPGQRGFEAQQVADYTVVAVNVYPVVPREGGALRVWNLLPDDKFRETLGIEHSGYPYPSEMLRHSASLDVELGTGDLIAMNGGMVHAVSAPVPDEDSTGPARLSMNFFLGYINRNTIVYWV